MSQRIIENTIVYDSPIKETIRSFKRKSDVLTNNEEMGSSKKLETEKVNQDSDGGNNTNQYQGKEETDKGQKSDLSDHKLQKIIDIKDNVQYGEIKDVSEDRQVKVVDGDGDRGRDGDSKGIPSSDIRSEQDGGQGQGRHGEQEQKPEQNLGVRESEGQRGEQGQDGTG